MTQTIEVIIPVHDPVRPLDRALRSVLAQRTELTELGVELRVTVVCHNIAIQEISGTLPPLLVMDDAVTWLQCTDGTKSPAGPRNAALEASSATYLCFLDSDDYLEQRSLSGWWKVAQEHHAAAVIAPLRTPEGLILRSPRIRPNKPAMLDPLKDGLAYRSVPYGLLRLSALHDCGFRYADGISIGEDLETTLKLWFRGGPIVYPYGAPAYHQTDDSGSDRVTSSVRPLADEFRWLGALVHAPWLLDATLAERRSIALKLMRVHGIGALLRRGAGTNGAISGLWSPSEQDSWATIRSQLLALAGGALPALSHRDAALALAAAKAQNDDQMRAAVARHSQAGRLAELLPNSPLAVLSPDSVLRHYVNERLRTNSALFDLR
ncbi:glycosyltransferase family A protein [Arthrobacter antibioticus]|uniref:glycosyltransferase family A protein n=1 Tax=Arthrobacter sp. H35-MC1 TaxID=3046203 RepID=UPI0024B8C785|nr:glycosyltransferase family A protein [Arthrobacter sp. H35-MC1]MDJ0316468.1 glycosyltransferase family A protein [Arthrobacter sp. H35-MC1]